MENELGSAQNSASSTFSISRSGALSRALLVRGVGGAGWSAPRAENNPIPMSLLHPDRWHDMRLRGILVFHRRICRASGIQPAGPRLARRNTW